MKGGGGEKNRNICARVRCGNRSRADKEKRVNKKTGKMEEEMGREYKVESRRGVDCDYLTH